MGRVHLQRHSILSLARRFEQLDGIAGRVVEEDLLAAEPGDDVVAKSCSSFAERLDLVPSRSSISS